MVTRTLIKLCVGLALLLAPVFARAADSRPPALARPLPHWTPDEDIVDHIDKQPDATTFAAALAASGLCERLKGPGRFTVLVPSNAAFLELPPGMLRDLMKTANKAQLARIVGCHIVAREIKLISQSMPMAPVTTIGGCKLRFFLDGTDFKVRDENGIVATLVRFDVFEANGQIEDIDAMLTPKLSEPTGRPAA